MHQFVDDFNQVETKMLLAACADQTFILDVVPPHEWHATGACAKWVSYFDADAKKNGITDGAVTLSNPSHVDITADRAYVVIPANYRFKQKGKPVSEVGPSLRSPCRRAQPVGELRDGPGRNIRRAAG